jgi:alpha-tubulin suppressor-like RCC1 family protein
MAFYNKTISTNSLTNNLIPAKIFADNLVWGCGYNGRGQLGLNDNVNRSTYTCIPNVGSYKNIVVSSSSTIILKYDGTVMVSGENTNGKFGLGYNNTVNMFSKFCNIPGLNNVTAIAGSNHIIALKNDGTVWGCGDNSSGQLGLTTPYYLSQFTSVPGITNIKKIAAGGYGFTVAVKNDGTVWATGKNSRGQLGISQTSNKAVFTSATNLSGIKQVSCGYQSSAAISYSGGLWVCGYNTSGQLGLSDIADRTVYVSVPNMSNVKQVACGADHIMVVKTDGTIWGAGKQAYAGQLGLSTNISVSTFTSVPGMTNVKSVACGMYSTVAVKTDGSIWATGSNSLGQLGLNDLTNRSYFVSVPGITNIKEVAGQSYNMMALSY